MQNAHVIPSPFQSEEATNRNRTNRMHSLSAIALIRHHSPLLFRPGAFPSSACTSLPHSAAPTLREDWSLLHQLRLVRGIRCGAAAEQEKRKIMEQEKRHPLVQPENPSNQQPTEAGKEGAKSSDEFMFEAYGDKYATRSADEGFGERYDSAHPKDPFHKDVKGDLAEELGIPELKNRDAVREKANITKETENREEKAEK